MDDSLVDRVLECVERIPTGRVMTYGDVAEYCGSRAPRAVGHVLSREGDGVQWHRVLRADGRCAPHIADEQRQRLLAEGVCFDGDRVNLTRYRWDGR